MASSPDYDSHFEPFDMALISPLKLRGSARPLPKTERATPVKRRWPDKENAAPSRKVVKVEELRAEKDLLETLLAGLDESVFDAALTPERPKRVKQGSPVTLATGKTESAPIASWSVKSFSAVDDKFESKVELGDVDMDNLLMGLDAEFDFDDTGLEGEHIGPVS